VRVGIRREIVAGISRKIIDQRSFLDREGIFKVSRQAIIPLRLKLAAFQINCLSRQENISMSG
jgi:hypothetical protein